MSPLELAARLRQGLSVTLHSKEAGARVRIGRADGLYTFSIHQGNAWLVARSDMTFPEARDLLYSIIIRNHQADEAAKHS